jgi:membrane protease YdiL (CAAX protease family)
VSRPSLFLDSRYEVRSGWKFVAYSTMLVVFFILTGMIVGPLAVWIDPAFVLMPRSDMRFLALNSVVLLIPSILALYFMSRFVDHVPVRIFGLARHAGWLRDFGKGLLFAAGMLALLMVGSVLLGSVSIQWIASADLIPLVALTVAVLLIAAFNEELVFRGYPLQVLLKGMGPWGAMFLISSIFALLHIRNEGATVSSTLNTLIAGVLLSRAYLVTRSIWLPFGIHFGWNAGTAIVLGMPVSGIPTASVLKTEVIGNEFIFGRGYGPEDGLLGTVVFLAAAAVITRLGVSRISPEIQAALSENAEKVYVEEV